VTFDKKSFKDLNAMTEMIAQRYFLARRLHQLKSEQSLGENEYCGEGSYRIYLFKVLNAFESLNDKEKILINSEFFFQNYEDWWKPIYTKASFYRYKKQAMLSFLGAFYNG